jgi:hypothetical protein
VSAAPRMHASLPVLWFKCESTSKQIGSAEMSIVRLSIGGDGMVHPKP